MVSSFEGRKSVESVASPAAGTARPEYALQKHFSRQRRGSVASSITSIGGSLDTALGWSDSFQETGQNAISTLLQPPIVRTGLQPHAAAPASSTHKPPTAKDIPPVSLTNIDHVDVSEFAAYLKQVGALHEQLRRVKESEEEQVASGAGTPRRTSSKDDLADRADRTDRTDRTDTDGYLRPGTRRTSATRKPSISSISSVSSANFADTPSPVRRGSSGFRRANQGPPPLSTIPSVYFDEDFHLENPRTFDVVSERSEVVPPSATGSSSEKPGTGNGNAPRKALATNAILQEKLSWYMDTVEMHLISSISTASSAFFTALGSLKELHTEAADSVAQVQSIRSELSALDQEVATQGLDIVQKQRRRQNVEQFHATVKQLKDILDGFAACESLVDEGRIEQALDGIADLEKLIAGDASASAAGYVPRDLRAATVLRTASTDLADLRYRVGKAYEAQLVKVLMDDLRRHATSFSRKEVLTRWNSMSARTRGGHGREPSAFPSYLAATDDLKEQLLPILTGLYRAKHISTATQVYRDAVSKEIRSLIKRPLPSSNDDDAASVMSTSTMGSVRTGRPHGPSSDQKSSTLARNLRALEREDHEELLVRIYTTITETLRRSTTQAKVLLDVASSVTDVDVDGAPGDTKSPLLSPSGPSGRPPPISDAGMAAQEQVHLALDINTLVGQGVDEAQQKIVKILRVRSEQNEGLPMVWFLRYFTLNLHFANECEALSGRSGTPLKTTVNGQIKGFLQTYSAAENQRLAQDMEKDQWSAKDFTDDDASVLQCILDASTMDAAAWSADVRLWTPVEDAVAEAPAADDPAAASAGKVKARTALIDGEPFAVPFSAVRCMEGVAQFMHLVVAIPVMTTEISSSIVQYLNIFNSRCTQMVLGAGARISAGLKNITTKHLAIASQALSFIATMIPYVREFIRRRVAGGPGGVSTASLMTDFDKVKRVFQEHQNTIFDKVVDIMSSRAKAHAATMSKIDWDDDDESDAVHPYMATLVKQTTLLYRNLAEVLPDTTARFVMTSVFASYTTHLGQVLEHASVKTQKGKDNMTRDLEYFQNKLAKVNGFDSTGEGLMGIAMSKIIQPPAPPPAPAKARTPSPPKPQPSTPPAEATPAHAPPASTANGKPDSAKAEASVEDKPASTAALAAGGHDDDAPPPPPPKDKPASPLTPKAPEQAVEEPEADQAETEAVKDVAEQPREADLSKEEAKPVEEAKAEAAHETVSEDETVAEDGETGEPREDQAPLEETPAETPAEKPKEPGQADESRAADPPGEKPEKPEQPDAPEAKADDDADAEPVTAESTDKPENKPEAGAELGKPKKKKKKKKGGAH